MVLDSRISYIHAVGSPKRPPLLCDDKEDDDNGVYGTHNRNILQWAMDEGGGGTEDVHLQKCDVGQGSVVT